MAVAKVDRDRQFLRRTRYSRQLQAGFVRQAVGLALVHVLRGPYQVFPRVRAASRAGRDVIQAAFVWAQQSPVYWQRLPSRSRMARAQSFGRFFGTLAKFTATITVGSFALGCKQGVPCCLRCAGPMLILTVTGMMNPLLIVGVAVAVAAEKILPRPEMVVRAVGVAAIAAGSLMAIR